MSLSSAICVLATLLCAILIVKYVTQYVEVENGNNWTSSTCVNGYMYKFIESLPDNMICLICQLAACNPHQRDCCGGLSHQPPDRISVSPPLAVLLVLI